VNDVEVGIERGREEVVIFFNDQRIVAPKKTWTGAELREFLKVPPENRLYKEEPGKHPDTLITPEMTVELKNGDKFYDLPPGIRG
jgi:hypothetical protein